MMGSLENKKDKVGHVTKKKNETLLEIYIRIIYKHIHFSPGGIDRNPTLNPVCCVLSSLTKCSLRALPVERYTGSPDEL